MPQSDSPDSAAKQVGPFQFVVLALSVLALTAIAADTFLPLPPEISRILGGVDLIACGIFFLDFVIRFSRAKSKGAFMKFGWIDLLASVPNIEFLRLGRFAAVFRVLRLLRGVRSLRSLLGIIYRNKGRGGITSVVFLTFLIIIFAAIGVLLCETAAHSNIKSAGDAVWWSVTTITTVGYGDHYPVTTGGRIIGMFLMLSGVGLFGTLSGVVALLLIGPSEADDALLAEIKTLRSEIDHLRSATAVRPPVPGEAHPPP